MLKKIVKAIESGAELVGNFIEKQKPFVAMWFCAVFFGSIPSAAIFYIKDSDAPWLLIISLTIAYGIGWNSHEMRANEQKKEHRE